MNDDLKTEEKTVLAQNVNGLGRTASKSLDTRVLNGVLSASAGADSEISRPAKIGPPLNILFLGHSATRTGAPILLLHLMRWLRANTQVNFQIALKQDGALRDQFSSLAPTSVVDPTSTIERVALKILAKTPFKWVATGWRKRKLLRMAARAKAQIVYANTAVVVEEVRTLADAGYTVIWHVHELRYRINAEAAGFGEVAPSAKRFIAASHCVADDLTNDFGIPAGSVETIHEFIPPPVLDERVTEANRRAVRRELGLPEDAFLAGGCGTIDWRKGPDLFVRLGKYLDQLHPEAAANLVWIGGNLQGEVFRELSHDLQNTGLKDKVRFVGAKEDPSKFLSALDVFVLTSRDDPFPLAMIEAASLGVPIVCFEKSGGAPELVENDAGKIVRYLDVLEMAEQVAALAKDMTQRQSLGRRARSKVLARYTTEKQAPKLFNLILKVAGCDKMT